MQKKINVNDNSFLCLDLSTTPAFTFHIQNLLKTLYIQNTLSINRLSIGNLFTLFNTQHIILSTHSLKPNTHVSQLVLRLRLDAKARDAGVGEAGRVLQLLHPADLGHGLGLLLLLLLVLRAGHLHLMLLVCRGETARPQHTLG